MKLLNSPFSFRAGREAREGLGGGGELEELFVYSDQSCTALEHVGFGQAEAEQGKGAAAVLHSQAAPWDCTRT